MSWSDFWIIFITCSITILICRVVPLFVLKGRSLSSNTKRALSLIPSASFAALVTNDIFNPTMFDAGLWPSAAIIIASIVVAFIAIKSKSLVICAISGVVVYAVLLII